MKRTATFKGWKLAVVLSFLVFAHLHTPHSFGQLIVRGTSTLPSLSTVAGQFRVLIEAFANMADAGVVWASGDDDDNANDNGTGNDDNTNDNGNGNGNDNDNDNENGNENGNDNDNGNDNGNENGNENGNGNDNGNGNENGDSQQVVEGEVIVQIVQGADPMDVAERHGLQIEEELDSSHIFRMGFPSGRTLEQVLAELATDPDVQQRESHFVIQPPEIETRSFIFIDTRSFIFIDGSSPGEYFDQEAMNRIRAEEAHRLSHGQGVTVAVVDTGIDFTHPALQGRILPDGHDFVQNDNDPSETCPQAPQETPGCGHGTFVASIISLVAPQAQILPIRAFDERGIGTAFNIAKAIGHAVDNGAVIINMSFGMQRDSFVIDFALRSAFDRGVLLVASAGNNNSGDPRYPAGKDNLVVAVAATDANDVKADFSNYGPHIDVSAPGVGIYGAYPDGRFGIWNGTSFAAPFVSGEAALLYSTTLTGNWVRGQGCNQIIPGRARRCSVEKTIMGTAVDIQSNNPGFPGQLGRGRIDVFAAVSQIRGRR